MRVLKKIIEVLKSPDRLRRIIHALNKSPFRKLNITLSKFLNLHSYKERKSLADSFQLNTDEEKALDDLKNQGYAKINNLIDLKLLKDVEIQAEEHLNTYNQGTDCNNSKVFWARVSDVGLDEKNKTSEYSAYVKFATQKSVVKIISKLMGSIPSLHYTLVTQSKKMDSNTGLQKSQLWHIDYDDEQVVKLFIFLNNIEKIEDAPFTFLPPKATQRVKNSFFARHLDDKKIDPNEIQRIFTEKCSVYLVNTSNIYHMGGRQVSDNLRLMYTAAFASSPSIYYVKDSHISYNPNKVDKLKSLLFRLN